MSLGTFSSDALVEGWFADEVDPDGWFAPEAMGGAAVFTAGTWRFRLKGQAAEASWLYVKIEGLGGSDVELWLDLANQEFGPSCSGTIGERTDGSLKGCWYDAQSRFNAKFDVGATPSSPKVTLRIVDGDGDTSYNGTAGDGLVIELCDIRQEVPTGPGVEVASIAVQALGTNWRRITPETPLVNTGTDPEYTDTFLAENESVLVEGREMLRVAHGWGNPFSLIDSRPGPLFTPLGFGQMASSCVAANDTEIAFISSDNGEDDGIGACILIYDDAAAPEYKVGLGEHVWAYVETGNLPPVVTFPDDYSGAEPRLYEPIGNVNDRILAHPAVWPPRAFPTVIGILIPRSTWFEDSTTTPPIEFGGHSWYVEQEIEEYTAITAGTYAEEWFAFHADDNDLGSGLIPDWFSAGNGIPLIRATKAPIWEDTYSQTRIVNHTSDYFAGDEEIGESAINRRAQSGACHVWCNMPATTGDSHGDVHGAIFTHGRAAITISGTAPWRSWIEGEDDPVPDVPTESADVTTWLTLAIGSAGTAGTVGDDNVRWEEEIWRDEDIYWIHNLSAVKAMEGTSRKGFVYGEKLYDEDPPTSESAGTVVGIRLHYCGQDGVDYWYIDTERTDLLPDCVASSDRWLYIVDFDADNDFKTSWAMSHEAADSMDPSAGPLYRHFASYDDGVNPIAHDPFPGGTGVGYVDSVKISAQVDQTPEVEDYS